MRSAEWRIRALDDRSARVARNEPAGFATGTCPGLRESCDGEVGAARIPPRDDPAVELASRANRPWLIGPLSRGCHRAGSAPCRMSCGPRRRFSRQATADSGRTPPFESGSPTGYRRARPTWPADFRTTEPWMGSEAHAPVAPEYSEPTWSRPQATA